MSSKVSSDPNPSKDDHLLLGQIAYWLLLMLFIGLAILGGHNILHKSASNSRSLFLFYVASLAVILLRIALFADVFLHYPYLFYVICLVTMPTFLEVITGLSLVMCNVELVLKFRSAMLLETHFLGC